MSSLSWIPAFTAALAATAAYGLTASRFCARGGAVVATIAENKPEAGGSARKPRRVAFLVASALAAGLTYLAVARAMAPAHVTTGAREQAFEAAAPAAAPVSVAAATQEQWPSSVTIPGNVSAVDTANIASRAGGLVTKVLVEAGDQVAEGQPLAKVGTADAQAQLAQAQARVNTAQAAYKQVSAEYQRYKTLHDKGFASTAQFQQAERQYFAAQAEINAAGRGLEAARTDVGYAEIDAPFAGIVAQKNVWPGDYANPAAILFVLASDKAEIRAQAGPKTFAALKVGDKAVARINGRDIPATVTSLVGAADARTRTHLVKLRLDGNAAAPFGAYADIRFHIGETPALSIPEAALTERAGLVSVFVVGADGQAHLRLVRTGARENGQVAILAGLEAGDKVILSPPPSLENGSPVSARDAIAEAHNG